MRLECHLARCLLSVAAIVIGACQPASRTAPGDGGIDAGLELGSTKQSLATSLCGPTTGVQAGASWPMRGGCPTRAAQSGEFGPVTGEKNWEADLGGRVTSSPVVAADGSIFVGSEANQLVKIDPATGAILKSANTLAPVRSSPAIGNDGYLYVGSDLGRVYRVDTTTLALQSKVQAFGRFGSSPTVLADGTIVIGSEDFGVYALDSATGAKKWRYRTSLRVVSSPAIDPASTVVYVGSEDFNLYALNTDGTLKWKKNLGAPVYATPAVGRDGSIYVSAGTTVYAVEPAEGAIRWQRSIPLSLPSSPAIGRDGSVYVGLTFSLGRGSLYAFGQDGAIQWHADFGAGVESTPIVDRAGNLYFGTKAGTVVGLDATGRELWKFEAGGEILGSPALAKGGAVIIGSTNGKLFSLGTGGPRAPAGGVCDEDSDCEPDLICGEDAGPRFGKPAGTGVCWVPTCENQITDPGETERDCGGPCGSCTGVCSSACSIGEKVAPPAQEVLSFASGTFTRGAPGTYQVSADKRATAGAHQLRYEDRVDGHGRLALFEGESTDPDPALASEAVESSEAVRRADRLVYDAADVPAWVRTGMWQVDVVPPVSSEELPANREHTLVAWENGSLALVREANSSAAIRISSGTTVVTRELGWDAGARITLTLNHPSKAIHVLGVSHGDGETSLGSIAIPPGRLAIGAKLDGTAAVFGRMSELRRVAAISVPCAPDPDCVVCGDGILTAPEECDPALDAHCRDDCSALLAEPVSCLEDSECPSSQVCGITFNATRYGGPELSQVCWPAFCESDPAHVCGTAQSPCGICYCSPNCTGQSCGSTAGDGCGDVCTGLCDQGEVCTQDSDCGVGQSCGTGNGAGFGKAPDASVCWDMRCEIGGAPGLDCGTWACVPQCDTRTCGDDGCGGSCGSCDGTCVEGQCVEAYTFDKPFFLPFPLERADPDSVGTLPGFASVGPLGTAEYSIPLEVPPAPGDMQPHLSLRYSSGLGNGLLGLGWTIAGPELSVIARCPRTSQDPGGSHPVVYTEDEKFCLDGTPLVRVGALPADDYGANVVVREYRTTLDSFSRISAVTKPRDSYPSHWVVTTKDGRRLSYGTQASSRILHKKLRDGRTEIAQAWAVDTVVDRSGNELRVAYERNPSSVGTAVPTGDLLPSVIRYGKLWLRGGRLVSDRTVTFAYENLARPDSITGYRGGQRFRRSKRLASVVTTLEDTRIPRQFTMGRSYWFSYRSQPVRQGLDALYGVGRPITEPSRLASVKMCAGQQRDSGCLPATEFSYVIDDEETPRQGGFPAAVPGPQVSEEGPPSGLLFDMNGDGKADRVWSRNGTFNLDLGERPGEAENTQTGPAESLLQREGTSTGASILHPDLLTHAQVVQVVGEDDPIIASDLDLDGFDDLVYPALDARAMVVLRSTGAKLSYAAYATRGRSSTRKEWLAFDVDGDGYQDLFRCGAVLGFMRNTGHGFDTERALSNVATLGSTTGVLSCPNQGGEGRPVTMDTDGDGVANLLLNWSSASSTFKDFVAVRFSQTSTGWGAVAVATGLAERMTQDPKQTHRSADVRPVVIDLNGDGLSDMLVPRLLTEETSGGHAAKKWWPAYCASPDGCVALETWINTGDPRKIFRNYGFLVTREQPIAEPEVADARGVERFITLPRSMLLQIQGAMPVDYDGDGRQDLILPGAPVWRTSQEERSKQPPSADDYAWRVYRGFRELDEAAPVLFAHTGDVTVGGGRRNFVDHLPIDARLEFADFDGNSVVDLHVWVPPLTSKRDFTRHGRLRIRHAREAVHLVGLGTGPDRMKLRRVTNGLGTVEQFDYAYGEGLHYNSVDDDACSYGTQCLQHLPGAVVFRRSIRTPDSSILRQFEHTYRGLKADPLNRTSVGFAVVTVYERSPDGSALAVNTTRFDQRTVRTSAGLRHPFASRPMNSSLLEFVEDGDLSRHPSYELLHGVDTSWSLATSDAGLPFVTLDARVEYSTARSRGETDHLIERRVDYAVDTYGNITQASTAWPDGVVTVESAYFDLSAARRARWQTNLKTATQQVFGRIENGQYRPGPYRRSSFEFDDRGLLSAVVREPFTFRDPFEPSPVAGSWVTEGKRTEFARDPDQHYNVTDVRELGHRADNDRTTHFEWTSDSIVPDSVRDNLGHTTYLEVDRGTGALLTQRAEDGTLTRWRRDAFGREYERQTPFGTSFTKRNGRQAHAPAERHMPADYTDFSVYELGSDGARQETFYNSLGMPVLVTRYGFQSRTTSQELTYDARGLLVTIERPHEGRTSTQGVIRFERDQAGRITRTVYPDGTSVTNLRARANFLRSEVDFIDPAHGDTVEGIINARGVPKLSLHGARGTTRAVFEYVERRRDGFEYLERQPDTLGSNWLATRYHYGAFDGLQRIEDPEHQVTEFGRDVYNRVTRRTDPASGTTSYRLDGFDQLRSTDDAQGQHVEYEYDSLGRLTRRVGAEGPASWAWDCLDAARGCGLESIGKLVHAERGGTTTDYAYDPATGLQASTTLSVEGEQGLFSTGASFRPQDGKLDVLTISGAGSAYAVRYNYDPRSGEAMSITNATSGEPLWTLESTHETFAPQVERFGSNLYRRTLYEEKTGRVQRVIDGPSTALTGASTDLSDRYYTYDANGNVKTVGSSPPSFPISFPLPLSYEYDMLDRLSKVSMLSTVERFSYDDAGNIAFKHDVGSYTYEDDAQPCDVTRSTSCAGAYDTYRPHAVRSAGDTTFEYDKNGNERWRAGPSGTLQTEYTDFSLPKRMTPDGDDAAAVSFGYDADGQRVVKRASGRTTVFMGDLYQRTVDATGEKHEFFIPLGSGAQLHVTRDGAGERSEYLLTDHLGSLHVAVGTGAGVPRTREFDAFGRVTGDPVEQDAPGFTGHRHDAELGLIDMKGRIYDPKLGRFLQPDPIMSLPVGTGLNRYAYVLNNPINFVDPWGLQAQPITLDTIYITGQVDRAVDGAERAWAGAERAAMYADARMDGTMMRQPGGGANSGVQLFGGGPAREGGGSGDWAAGAYAGAIDEFNDIDFAALRRPTAPGLLDNPNAFAAITCPATGCPSAWAIALDFAPAPLAVVEVAGTKAVAVFERVMAWALGKGAARALPNVSKVADHHLLPRQFGNFFKSRGIAIDQFTVTVAHETTHLKGIHGKGLGNMPGRWNQRWQEFIDAFPDASPKQVYQQLGKMMDDFGLSGLPIHPYKQ